MLAVFFSLLLAVAACVGVSLYQFSKYVDKTSVADAEKSLQGLADEVASSTKDALERAKGLASNPSVIAAVAAKDPEVLLKILPPMIKDAGLDFVTVSDSAGLVILRTHNPAKAGDSVAKQANVSSALKGTPAAFVESGTEIKLSARAGVPVKDAEGNIVGVLSARVPFG